MKLVELLADQLQSWPTGVVAYAQDASGDIYGYSDEPRYSAAAWVGGAAPGNTLGAYAICDDQATSFVTRPEWQLETEANHAAQIPEFFPEPSFDAVAAGIRVRQIVDAMAEMRDERDRLCAELAEHGLAVPGIEYRRPLKDVREAYPGLAVCRVDDLDDRAIVLTTDRDGDIRIVRPDGSDDYCSPDQLIALPA